MSRFQAIENGLKGMNGAVFQELCDSYLKLTNKNYLAFSRTGSQVGKQKTTRGTPDSFFLLSNGNYLFVETTTDVSTKAKLANDIQACFDFKKTKIPINKVEEIVLCINFNIDQKEILKLNTLVKRFNNNATVRYLMLQELALELHLNHRNLTHEYLGLPLDTGQIVSMDTFIREYNRVSKGISTPLDNTFLHREQELKDLKEAIDSNDFVILTGAPGVGKTKLALEGIQSYVSKNLSFQTYCISYKHHILLDDLFQYFDPEKDYILFVDDANRIDAFNQIIGFYKGLRKGQLKIVITVRDYAFNEVRSLCNDFSPMRLDVERFTDEQIIEIIKEKPFEILNPRYYKEIVRIADGNPRLAIMVALLAKAEQNIEALNDVSHLFENYFSTFVKDEGEFAKELNIKCLGLIAFFYTIPYKNKEVTNSILEKFGVNYSDFIDAIDILDKLELVEIQYEHVKIPEQNLSTYFFYKAFIKDNLLSFEILLSEYFEGNSGRFRDCVIPANNTFGAQNVMDKLLPFLQDHWLNIRDDNEKANSFLSVFWFYLGNETLEYVFNIVESLPEVTNPLYTVTYGNNDFAYAKNGIIRLLGDFFNYPSEHLKDALELAFEYARKKPEHLPEVIHKIREKMTFDEEDERKYRLKRQNTLFNLLIDGVNDKDLLLSISFFELSKTFLAFKFQQYRGGRKNTVSFYNYPIRNSLQIQNFRKSIWDTVKTNWNVFPEYSFDLIKSYSGVAPDVDKKIMEFDVPLLKDIIETHLDLNSFEHCKYVQDQIRWCIRNSIIYSPFGYLKMLFTNSTYESYLKIDWDRFRDKDMYDFENYQEYEKLKEAEIRNSFVFKDENEIDDFYRIFVSLKNAAENDWNYNNTLDIIIDENCTQNFNMGCQMINQIIKNDNNVDYVPWKVFQNHLNCDEKIKHIWGVLQEHDFNKKYLWELSFYDKLDKAFISINFAEQLVNTISNVTSTNRIRFDQLSKFLPLKPDLFQVILRTIFEKNKKNGTKLQVWQYLFIEHFDELGDDIDLIARAYIQQSNIQAHFDLRGEGMINIMSENPQFLLEYVDSLYSPERHGFPNNNLSMSFIWQVKNIEIILDETFDLVTSKGLFTGILEHFCNVFFKNIEHKEMDRGKTFLMKYLSKNYLDVNKINAVVDVVRHSMPEIFEEMLLLFLSLCQNVEVFSKVWWRGNGGVYSGNVIIADVEMAEWKNIQSIIEKSKVGIKLLPIKSYVNEKIEACKKSGDWERQRRFTSKF